MPGMNESGPQVSISLLLCKSRVLTVSVASARVVRLLRLAIDRTYVLDYGDLKPQP
jgi:hypothetical protein